VPGKTESSYTSRECIGRSKTAGRGLVSFKQTQTTMSGWIELSRPIPLQPRPLASSPMALLLFKSTKATAALHTRLRRRTLHRGTIRADARAGSIADKPVVRAIDQAPFAHPPEPAFAVVD
jgi:hypothetical protein